MSNKKNLLNSVKIARPPRNTFELSFDVKTSLGMGYLVPTFNKAVLPGDTVSLGCDSLIRLLAMITPPMHRMNVSMHYFFCPYRLLWPGWEEFITQDASSGSIPAFPTLAYGPGQLDSSAGSLANYLGIPDPSLNPGASTRLDISAMFHSAYQFIWNEYYRDQNLQSEIQWELIDGDNSVNADLEQLRLRAWPHDYFTACLPFAQKGNPVQLPIGQFEDVSVSLDANVFANGGLNIAGTEIVGGAPGNLPFTTDFPSAGASGNIDVFAKTSQLSAQAALINDLRTAFRVQEWQEKNARGGTRYNEYLKVHFGVNPSDKRLQRPEYITGTKSPITISEVLATADTPAAPQGNMAGHGVGVQAGKYGSYYCEEFGCIIGIMSVIPESCYMQGLDREFLKTADAFQYYDPTFANLGEQTVSNNEVYAFMANGNDDFGYLPRYAEYKFCNNMVTGQMASTLDFWHLARKFSSQPNLNSSFIECLPSQRIFATNTSDQVLAHIYHRYRNSRLMPVYGTPTF